MRCWSVCRTSWAVGTARSGAVWVGSDTLAGGRSPPTCGSFTPPGRGPEWSGDGDGDGSATSQESAAASAERVSTVGTCVTDGPAQVGQARVATCCTWSSDWAACSSWSSEPVGTEPWSTRSRAMLAAVKVRTVVIDDWSPVAW